MHLLTATQKIMHLFKSYCRISGCGSVRLHASLFAGKLRLCYVTVLLRKEQKSINCPKSHMEY